MKFCIILLCGTVLGKPTEHREWTSSVDSKLSAKATGIDGQVVLFDTGERVLRVPLDQLAEEDQKRLKDHFKEELAAALKGPPAKNLPHPQGKDVGPIDAGDGSSYWLYLPTTMSADTQAPLIFWTGAGGGDPKRLAYFKKAAEVTGMVIAASKEARNQGKEKNFVINHRHTLKCLEHIAETLPVDMSRVFFTGQSGGGATAFYNAARIDCGGALPLIGYIPYGSSPPSRAHYFIATGATDFNRYYSARAAEELGKGAIYRPYIGRHNLPQGTELYEEGLIWLYSRNLYERMDDGVPERARFERRMLDYLKGEKAWRSYFWAKYLTEECDLSADIAQQATTLANDLERSAENVRYVDGLEALQKAAARHYANGPKRSSFGHVTDDIRRAFGKLAEEYAGVPEIEELARQMSQPTQKR